MMSLMRAAGVLAGISLLGACAGSAPPPSSQVNLAGYSTAFKQGYSDGCKSAGSRGTVKNESRYRDDSDYTMGWNDGFSICTRR